MHDDATQQPKPSSNLAGMLDAARRRFEEWRRRVTYNEAAEVYSNLARIDRIPHKDFPHTHPARVALRALALRGHDVDAYTPVSKPDLWVIWCRPPARTLNGRYTIAEWIEAWEGEYNRIVVEQEARQTEGAADE